MLFVSYVLGFGIVLAALSRGRSRRDHDGRRLRPVAARTALELIAAGAIVVGVVLFAGADPGSLARPLSLGLVVGGASYLVGIAFETGVGFALRAIGFSLIFVVALVPSTLTLLLPLAALLAFGLGDRPRDQPSA